MPMMPFDAISAIKPELDASQRPIKVTMAFKQKQKITKIRLKNYSKNSQKTTKNTTQLYTNSFTLTFCHSCNFFI